MGALRKILPEKGTRVTRKDVRVKLRKHPAFASKWIADVEVKTDVLRKIAKERKLKEINKEWEEKGTFMGEELHPRRILVGHTPVGRQLRELGGVLENLRATKKKWTKTGNWVLRLNSEHLVHGYNPRHLMNDKLDFTDLWPHNDVTNFFAMSGIAPSSNTEILAKIRKKGPFEHVTQLHVISGNNDHARDYMLKYRKNLLNGVNLRNELGISSIGKLCGDVVKTYNISFFPTLFSRITKRILRNYEVPKEGIRADTSLKVKKGSSHPASKVFARELIKEMLRHDLEESEQSLRLEYSLPNQLRISSDKAKQWLDAVGEYKRFVAHDFMHKECIPFKSALTQGCEEASKVLQEVIEMRKKGKKRS